MGDGGRGYLDGLELSYTCEEEEGGFASHCPELGVSSCGDTYEEARSNILEAVEVHLESLAECGELDRYLAERGLARTRVLDIPLSAEEFPDLSVGVRPEMDSSGILVCPVDSVVIGGNVVWAAGESDACGQTEAVDGTALYSRAQ